MSLRLLIGLLILCGARRAGAERRAPEVRVIVVEAPGAPFEARDLVEAIRVRVAADGAPVRVRVTAIDRGVRVEARGVTREVDLAGLRGAAAARLVALATNDLLLDDLATPPMIEARAMRTPERSATTIGVFGGVAGWDGVLGNLVVDLALPRGAWLVAIDAGGGQLVGNTVHLTAGVLRLAAGYRAGWFELRGGATLVPLFVTSGAGDRTVLLGAGASARVRIPISDGVRGVAAGGADAFATRTHYEFAGMPAMVTPRFAPWLSLGVEVAL